jgi:hypothetical protein
MAPEHSIVTYIVTDNTNSNLYITTKMTGRTKFFPTYTTNKLILGLKTCSEITDRSYR